MIKKIIKWGGLIILIGIIALVIAGITMNEPKPEGNPSVEADAVANKMLQAINQSAWDSTRYVQWSFPGGHDYLWDKEADKVRVQWKDNEVILHTKSITGKAFAGGAELSGEAAAAAVQTAWGYFCNDSFWLNAPAKVFDPGTSRKLVTLDDGTEGLMVSYDTGGVTPGDSYFWILDENGLPKSYKMWVKIIPVGGMEFSWEGWKTLSTGCKIAQMHKSIGPTLELTNIKAAMDWSAFGEESNPFE